MDNNLLWIRKVITSFDKLSEDIDIALSPEALGLTYQENPPKKFVVDLKKAGCAFTTNELLRILKKELTALDVPPGVLEIVPAPVPDNFPDTDPQTIFVRYRSLFDPSSYIASEVKVEVGVRSFRTPHERVSIQSMLNEFNPNHAYSETPFPVEATHPRKTMIEKMFLMHELLGKPDQGRIKTERMSRHYYDLAKIMQTEVLGLALKDHELYDHLIDHRRWYSRISWVDYDTLHYSTLSFLPASPLTELFEGDYQLMQEQMIYEEAMPFAEVLEQLAVLQNKFRTKK